MGHTLYLDPLLGTLKIKTTMGGMFVPPALPNQQVVWVEWPNGGRGGGSAIPSNGAANTAVENLWTAVQANIASATAADPMRIVGHSGGAQAIMKFIREKWAALKALLISLGKPLNAVQFYCLGCPEQKFTGASYLYTANSPPAYPGDGTRCGASGGAHDGTCPTPLQWHGGYGLGYGLPEPCEATVHVVSNQWDGWSMAPTNMNHPELNKIYDALLFVLFRKVWDHSIICYLKSSTGPHGRYDTKDSKTLSSPDVFSHLDPANPTVRYYYVRTYPFPGYDKIWARFLQRNKDMANRASIDAAFAATDATHGMQITIPAPDYTAVPTWFPL